MRRAEELPIRRSDAEAQPQVLPPPGSRRVVSTEWTAEGVRAAATAGERAAVRFRHRGGGSATGLQRHGSVSSALEARA